jgi:hypothetical protein
VPQYGSTWSKFIPGLGSDKEAEEHAVLVENMLSCVRSVVESVSASSSVLFGPFAIPHGSAISARGLICFLSTAMAKQGAEEFAQVRLFVDSPVISAWLTDVNAVL